MKLDELMPEYDVRTSHRVQVRASPDQVWSALLEADFSESFLIRFLMSIRTGRVMRRQANKPLREHLAGAGFMVLAEISGQEIVLGVAGRFWRPDGGRCLDLTPADFAGFRRLGYARAAGNLTVTPTPPGCLLSTETRVQCFGRAALLRFRAYWTVVRPFSGLIRRAILHQLKHSVESRRTRAVAR